MKTSEVSKTSEVFLNLSDFILAPYFSGFSSFFCINSCFFMDSFLRYNPPHVPPHH